jgi:hypothetical protein
LEEDASDRLWALLGRSVHTVLAGFAPAIIEEKLEFPVGEFVVVARIDAYVPARMLGEQVIPAQIEDHKIKSVWSYVLGDKKDIEQQMNCYAWAERKYGRPVGRLVANAILRDHVRNKALQDADYPPQPFYAINIPLWGYERQCKYIEQRVALHSKEGTECTDGEKWQKPTTYAIMKKGRKSALRVLESEKQAFDWCSSKGFAVEVNLPEISVTGDVSIVERLGECTRCKSYCPVRSVCSYNKEQK